MNWYLLKLIAHRPDFAVTMTAEEQATMERHADYWTQHLREGTALIFSPVGDPDGVWGMAVARAADRDGAEALTRSDPAVLEGVGTYRILDLLLPVTVQDV